MSIDPIQKSMIHRQPLVVLVAHCQKAQAKRAPTHGEEIADDGACFELLRRGLEEQNDEAWRAFEAQFQSLFYYWIQQDLIYFGLTHDTNEELEDIWAEARSRFVGRYARLQTLSDTFHHIGAVLNVLHKCIRSAVQEVRRQQERQQRLVIAIEQIHFQQSADLQLPATQIELEELRRCITNQIEQDVPEAQLRRLLILRYVDDLKPREISTHYPDEYPNAAAVHTALERIMKRLRRRIEQYVTRCL